MSSLPTRIIDALAQHALSLGHFEQVNVYEPKSSPQTDLMCTIWVQSLRPTSSGLTSTSVRFQCSVRIYTSMLQEPPDIIDPVMMAAAWDLLSSYSGAFTLGGLVESVDLLGKDGDPLSGEAGYIEIDRKMFRVFTITLPVKINDAFDQVA
jgi:hypothetical protein